MSLLFMSLLYMRDILRKRQTLKMNGLIFLFTLFIVQVVKGDSIVQTDSGPVQGKTVASGKVEAFLGIPYAEPPVGSFRFSKPVTKTSWADVYDATQLPPPCIQLKLGKVHYAPDLTNMSEDCLYLNVWVPRSNTRKLRAIMLFIHGGGFILGSSNMELYDGATLSEYGDVVVVTVNYRVGGLGFFTGFNEEAPGSLGLYDQVMAMEWIKRNAKHFQGDPDLIVLFGESAGAFSVSMHQISPLSKHLFRRAILQSGSAINPSYSDGNEQLAITCDIFADMLGCTNDRVTLKSNPAEVVDCLKNVPAEKFPDIDMMLLKKSLMFSPRIGNDFLPKNTIDTYKQGEFKDSEVLMGITRDEGTLLVIATRSDLFGMLGEKDVSHVFNETTAYITIKALVGHDGPVTEDIIHGYLDQVNKDETGYAYLKAVSEAFGDNIITCGNIFQAEYQSLHKSSVYFYMFNHRPSSTLLAEWMGVTHYEEVQFVFGNSMYQEFTEFESELSRDMMNMWVTFAKTGNPNIPGGVTWPRYTYEDPKYFIIGKRDKVDLRPDHYRCERWRQHFRSVIDDDVIQALKRN